LPSRITFRAVHSPRLVILADAHLGAAPPEDEAALLRFLDTVPREGDTLLLAGDIFDFWFSYRRLIPRRNFRVTAALTTLARRLSVAMIGGNHDRWGDSFWREDAGIAFDPHRLRLSHGGHQVLAIHGDGLHEERPGAAWMHKATSSRLAINLFRALHPDLGFRIADMLGHNLDYGVAHPEVLVAAAERQQRWAVAQLLGDPLLSAIVMGHTHREAAVEVQPGRWYVNPGAWLDGHRYATLDATGAHLHTFG
jgi:UDP-2,3-diacylglucosamine hydrolase